MYNEIKKVNCGRELDIKIMDYFTADLDKVDEERLRRDINEICCKIRPNFKEEMEKRGYSISSVNDIRQRKLKINIPLLEFLLKQTEVGELIRILDNGWYVGSTVIDVDNDFVKSLDNDILKRKVIKADFITTKIGKIEVPAIRVNLTE